MPKTKDEASEASQTLLQIIEQNSADNAKLADKLNSVAGAAIDTIVKVMQAPIRQTNRSSKPRRPY